MGTRKIAAIVLVVLGIVVLAYSGIAFQTRGKPVEIGPVQIETTRNHFIPPVVGAVALIGGIALWLAGGRKD